MHYPTTDTVVNRIGLLGVQCLAHCNRTWEIASQIPAQYAVVRTGPFSSHRETLPETLYKTSHPEKWNRTSCMGMKKQIAWNL